MTFRYFAVHDEVGAVVASGRLPKALKDTELTERVDLGTGPQSSFRVRPGHEYQLYLQEKSKGKKTLVAKVQGTERSPRR